MPEPYYTDGQIALHLGDCRDILPTLADASVDAICTDPPYEIGFMGRGWDATGIAYDVDMWKECLRVLKPGGHLLAFGATRTSHRLACAIEDAGFEIRDTIQWIYGNGMPKGQNIAKGIDRRRDDRTEILRVTSWLADQAEAAGVSRADVDRGMGTSDMGGWWLSRLEHRCAIPTLEQWERLRTLIGFDTTMDAEVHRLNSRKGEVGDAWNERPTANYTSRPGMAGSWTAGAGWNGATARGGVAVLDVAKRWEGWSTVLKPAHEPIVVARKSTGFNTTVANVLQYGTGALNIDACRTDAGQDYRDKCASVVGIDSNRNGATLGTWTGTRQDSAHDEGRWPTNVVFTHSFDCDLVGHRVIGGDTRAGQEAGRRPSHFVDTGASSGDPRPNGTLYGSQTVPIYNCAPGCPVAELDAQTDGASRFFPVFRYEPKAPASERPRLDDGTVHNTVKPLDLVRWLVRLITPPGGTVLDHFVGSGTTLEACIVEGFHAIGVEKDSKHAELCVARLSKPIQPTLDGAA